MNVIQHLSANFHRDRYIAFFPLAPALSLREREKPGRATGGPLNRNFIQSFL